MDRDQIPLTIYFTKFYLTAGNRSYLCLVLKSTQFWPQMFQIKFIFLMIFYEDNGQNLKTMLHFIQTKKKSHRQFDDEKYFGVCPILQ